MPQDPNLPPGVSIHMIPGNRPEDLEEEAWWDELEKNLKEKHNLEVEDEFWSEDWFQTAILVARDMGVQKGWNDARMEADIDKAMREEQEAESRLAEQIDKQESRQAELNDMKEAHSEGLHDNAPREFCPYCEER